MTDDMRLECLRLASLVSSDERVVMRVALEYANFVEGLAQLGVGTLNVGQAMGQFSGAQQRAGY
jgi:hypothetical protein